MAVLSGTISLDGNVYTLARNTRIARRARPIFAGVTRQNAQAGPQDFGLYQQVSLTGPLSIGQRQGNSSARCFDQYNVDARWPGVLLRGPQRQSATMSNFPATFTKTQFFESKVLSKVFVFGNGGSASDEPVHIATAATFADATVNADLATIDITRIVGMAEIGNTVYAIAQTAVTNGTNLRCTFQTTDGTTWSFTYAAAADETIGGSADADNKLMFLRADSGAATNIKLAAVYWDNDGTGGTGVRGTVRVLHRDAYVTPSSLWGGSNFGGGADIVEDSVEPRGFELFRGPDGALDCLVSTHITLWWGDRSNTSQCFSRVHSYIYPQGSYTGTLCPGADGRSMYFADGPSLGRYRWLDGINGPGKAEYPLAKLAWPLDAQGDVTAIWLSKVNPRYLYFAKSGTAASRNARVYIYDTESSDDDPVVFCIYRNATAQRAIIAGIQSSYSDGTVRDFFTEEQAAGGDQDVGFFANTPFHPLENSSYAYAASGVILDSERKPLGGLPPVGWMAIQVDADSLSANELVSIKDGQNGTAPANSQNITSSTSPAQVWPDKTDASAGVGVSAKRQQIEVTLTGTAGATVGPTIKEVSITYLAKGLLADATTAEEFEFAIDLDASAQSFNIANARGNPKAVLTALQTTADKVTLVALILDTGETVYVSAEVADAAIDQGIQEAIQQGPASGVVVVRCQQVVR